MNFRLCFWFPFNSFLKFGQRYLFFLIKNSSINLFLLDFEIQAQYSFFFHLLGFLSLIKNSSTDLFFCFLKFWTFTFFLLNFQSKRSGKVWLLKFRHHPLFFSYLILNFRTWHLFQSLFDYFLFVFKILNNELFFSLLKISTLFLNSGLCFWFLFFFNSFFEFWSLLLISFSTCQNLHTDLFFHLLFEICIIFSTCSNFSIALFKIPNC